MATHIAALGLLQYRTVDGKSVTFPGDTKTSLVSRHIKSTDGRTIKYVEHTLTVSGWLFSADLTTASNTVDAAFDYYRECLSQPGGWLTMQNKGCGNFEINQNTSNGRDVLWGPFPKVITWEPHGNITCKVEWEVTFTLPWRKRDVSPSIGVLDYWWTTDYSYDSEGFCTRVISGEIEIAGSRLDQQQSVNVNFNVEAYVAQWLKVTCPTGFHRLGHRIQTSAGKDKITFSFTDEADRGLTFPPGIADMDIVHEMSAQAQNKTISSWIWFFHATATPEAQFPSAYAYNACLAAFQQRFQFMIRNCVNSQGVILPFPVQIKVSENTKSRTTSLTSAWLLQATGQGKNGTFMPMDILRRSGMWRPFPWSAVDHKKVADQSHGPNATGGFNQLATDVRENVIIDISLMSPVIPDPGRATGFYKIQTEPADLDLVIQPFGAYMQFECYLSVKTEGDIWVNYPLTLDANAQNKFDENKAQKLGEPYNMYRVHGHIIRCGIPTEGIPTVKNVFGKECKTPAGEQIINRTYPVTNAMGMLLWRTDFMIPLQPVTQETGGPMTGNADKDANGGEQKPGNNALKIRNNELVNVPDLINFIG